MSNHALAGEAGRAGRGLRERSTHVCWPVFGMTHRASEATAASRSAVSFFRADSARRCMNLRPKRFLDRDLASPLPFDLPPSSMPKRWQVQNAMSQGF